EKFSTTLSGSALTQAAFAEFLSSGGYDHHLRRIRSVYAGNVARMRCAIADGFPAGTKVSRPAGGFVLWVELPKSVDTRKLFEDALTKGICFAPGDVFSATKRYSNCLRLSAGYPWDQRLERGVWKLGEMARAALR
ncbi:MAG: PLP-dependent aminotransferase family protein, partial [Candidatus Eremiobacteraeota bacterium]|nr:PLP-dependent aminotransferase family protein [Candidatus Eremiobacteraeota bacterium]